VCVTYLPIYLRRGEGECKIRIPTDGSNLRPQAVNTWAVGATGITGRGREGERERESAPDLTIYAPGAYRRWKSCAPSTPLCFFGPVNRSSSKFPKHPGSFLPLSLPLSATSVVTIRTS